MIAFTCRGLLEPFCPKQANGDCWYLAKGNGQYYCSNGSTLGSKSMHWNLPELQTARFVNRWCFSFLISPQFSILWPVLYLGSWSWRPYGHNTPRYLERVRYLMRSTRLGFLDVLACKASRDYACGINADADFETTVYELKTYFGFFRLQRTCETILHFYSYDGATNYVRCRTGRLQGDCPEFMVFCLVTLHL